MTLSQRVLRGVPATLTVTLTDSNGTAADAAGALTVGVAKADGTSLVAAGTATTHSTAGVYTVALSAALTATLETLTASWTDAGTGTIWTSTHEIVGGYPFSIAEARKSDVTLNDASRYPDADILAVRREVEDEAEAICDRAFVPRYRRITVDGSGTEQLIVPTHDIRTIRSVRQYTPTGSSTYTALTATQLGALVVTSDGQILRTDSNIFNEGVGNIVIELEYGLDTAAADMRRAMCSRLRTRINIPLTAVPDRATSFSTVDGKGTYALATAGVWETGIPDIDAVYERYSLRSRGKEHAPASRSMNLDPQYYSLYHGGRR